MRTSRVAKETARLFDAATAIASTSSSSDLPVATTRRTTRASALATRFSYRTRSSVVASSSSSVATPTKKEEDDEDDDDDDDDAKITFGSDIEDAIKPITAKRPTRSRNGGSTTVKEEGKEKTRKRKRTTTTSVKPEPASRQRVMKMESKTTTVETEDGTETEKNEDEIKDVLLSKRRVRKAARTITTKLETGGGVTTVVEPPSDWEEVYNLVKQMRISGPAANAAVDTMGCERLAAPTASARDRRFHTLVALMLSSQTKDTVNAEAMQRLQTELPPYEDGQPAGLTLENMLAVDPGTLNELIGKVGFHNNKTKYLKQAAVILRDRFDGDIPPTIEGLMSLPGVGPKMAHLCMSADNGWGRVEGIGVDVHVHRITNLWGWQNPPTKTPEDTRMALQSWLPKEKWKEINWLLVGLGQAVCLPVGRRCGDCELGLRGLCKAADRKKVNDGLKKRKEGGYLVNGRVKMEGIKGEDGDEGVGVGGSESVKVEVDNIKREQEAIREETGVEVDVVSIKKVEEEESELSDVGDEDIVMKEEDGDEGVKGEVDNIKREQEVVREETGVELDVANIKKEEEGEEPSEHSEFSELDGRAKMERVKGEDGEEVDNIKREQEAIREGTGVELDVVDIKKEEEEDSASSLSSLGDVGDEDIVMKGEDED